MTDLSHVINLEFPQLTRKCYGFLFFRVLAFLALTFSPLQWAIFCHLQSTTFSSTTLFGSHFLSTLLHHSLIRPTLL